MAQVYDIEIWTRCKSQEDSFKCPHLVTDWEYPLFHSSKIAVMQTTVDKEKLLDILIYCCNNGYTVVVSNPYTPSPRLAPRAPASPHRAAGSNLII
jgi:hypothetical protein